MERAASAFGKFLEALALLGCAVIFLMTLMICADVLLRNVRLVPGVYGIAWANEVSEAMLYLVTMLIAPWLLRQGQHIRVDIVLRAVPPRLGWVFEWIADSLGLVCCLVIAWYGARATLASLKAGSLSVKTLIIPTQEYSEGRNVTLTTGRSVYTVALRHLVEQRAEWSWAAIQIVEKKSRV